MAVVKGIILILVLCLPRQQSLAQQGLTQAQGTANAAAPEAQGSMDDELDHAADEDVGPTQPEPPASVIESFFNDLSASTVAQKTEAAMAQGVAFDDPFGKFDGRDKALEHLKNLLGEMRTLNVEVKEEFVSGDETVALWTMTYTNKHLHSGEPVTVDGFTRVRQQNGKIVTLTNQFDLGAAYYEQLPVIGWLVRWAKAKVSA